MQQLTDRVAVVTGAGSGIGRALAQRFAAEGMKLVLADIEDAALAMTQELVTKDGAQATARPTDVGDEAAVTALADHAYETFGAVHVLCNNAGVFTGGQMWTRPAADTEWVLRVNLWGVLHGIRAFVPRMIEQDTEGHIVNTSSAAGLFAAPYSGAYSISKFGVYSATECLAHELVIEGTRLRASVLCPGGVHTRIHQARRNRPAALATEPSDDQALIDQVISATVTKGIAPEQVAADVVDAIRAERFLILTHPSYADGLRAHTEALLAGRLPGLPDFESRT